MHPVFWEACNKRVWQSDAFLLVLRINAQMQTVNNINMYNWVYMDIHMNSSKEIFLLVNSSFNVTAIFYHFILPSIQFQDVFELQKYIDIH